MLHKSGAQRSTASLPAWRASSVRPPGRGRGRDQRHHPLVWYRRSAAPSPPVSVGLLRLATAARRARVGWNGRPRAAWASHLGCCLLVGGGGGQVGARLPTPRRPRGRSRACTRDLAAVPVPRGRAMLCPLPFGRAARPSRRAPRSRCGPARCVAVPRAATPHHHHSTEKARAGEMGACVREGRNGGCL